MISYFGTDMKPNLFPILLLLVSLTGYGQSTLPTVIRKIEGFKHPESVAYDGRFFYVSNLGDVLDPMAKDGDGFISKVSKSGEIVAMNAFPEIKLNSPKGLTVLNDVLFLTDVDSVMGIDVKTRQLVWGRTLDGTKYLNDILARDENTLYVSATDINQIFEIDLLSDSIRTLPLVQPIMAPNGLSADLVSSFLYVASFGVDDSPGELGRLNLRTLEYEPVLSEAGKFDGLFYASGRYYVSDWGKKGEGRLFVYDVRTDGIREIKPEQGRFKGPADFYVELGTRRIWLPCMLENAVYILNGK